MTMHSVPDVAELQREISFRNEELAAYRKALRDMSGRVEAASFWYDFWKKVAEERSREIIRLNQALARYEARPNETTP